MKRISAITHDEAVAAYQDWRRRFEARSDACIALKSLERELSAKNPERFPALREQVLVACFNACRLKNAPATDDYEQWREQAERLSRRDDEVLDAIKLVRNALKASPLSMSIAIANGRLEPDVMPPLEGPRTEYAEKCAEVLLALERGIKIALEERLAVSPATLNRIGGCLEYPAELHLNASKPDHAINGLVFELASLFKLWDASQETVLPRHSYWKKEGRPRYALVAEFVNVALDIDEQQFAERKAMDRIRDLLANHPGIQYIGWSYDLVGTPEE